MKGLKSILKSLLRSLSFGIPMAVAFTDCVAYVAKVDGVSMQPTLNDYDADDRSSDFVLLSHWALRNYEIKRGQIVSIISPREPNQRIIKRIVALEGDTVITRSNCKHHKVIVPKGHCWVEGDHHSRSLDSNIFGPVAVGLITAHALCIVWPPKRWQQLHISLPDDRTAILYSNNSCLVTINTIHDIHSDESISLIE